MRAVRVTERGIEVVDVPRASGAGVRVRIRAAGICGSDLKVIESGPMPFTLGHEMSGELADGSAVAIEPLLPCGRCEQCRSGEYQRCDHAIVTIMGVGSDGGMCDELLVPERCLVPLPPTLRVTDACLVEPMAVAVHALRLAGVTADDTVSVIGAGTIGLCALATARAVGCTVQVDARHEHQRAAADRLGAVDSDMTADVTVVAVGSETAVDRAVQCCRPGGTVVLVGTFWERCGVPGLAAMMKELRIISSFAYGRHPGGRDVDRASAILAADPRIPETLITHRYSLDEAGQAFVTAADRSAGAIKVAVIP